MNSKIIDIVIQNVEFFGLASDSEISPDTAVRQLEIVSTLLKDLSATELDEFFAHAEKRLEKLRADGAPQEQLEFLKHMREHLGFET